MTKLAGRDVLVRFAEEVPIFNQFVMRLPIGKPVQAVVLRGGSEKALTVTPVERESVDARIRELPLLGITASESDRMERERAQARQPRGSPGSRRPSRRSGRRGQAVA